jgi:hypothetical protein
MSIPLTAQQQQALDVQGRMPLRFIDPRTSGTYVLIPESEYDDIRDLLEEERRQRIIHQMAVKNAVGQVEEWR